MVFFRQALALTLTLSLTLTSLGLKARESAFEPHEKFGVLHLSDLEAAQSRRLSQRSSLARLNLSPANVDQRFHGALRQTGAWVNEIIGFQAMVVILSVAHYQMSKERAEMARLAQGLSQEPSTNTQTPTSSEWCASNSQNSTEDILCSGEFVVGLVGGAGALLVNQTALAILRRFVKESLSRSALGKLIVQMSAMTSLLAGGQAASFLWTDAVKLLEKTEDMERAKGVAGRAALALTQGQWSTFKTTDDGKIFFAILERMNKIMVIDTDLRNDWMANTWRFGLFRGEFIAAIGTLMGATAIGSAAGAGAAGLAAGAGASAGVAGLSAPVISFIVASAIGFAALNILFESGLPTGLTRALQKSSMWLNQQAMHSTQTRLLFLANVFQTHYYPAANHTQYQSFYLSKINDEFKLRAEQRSQAATVGIENLYELRTEAEAYKQKLRLLDLSLKNRLLRAHMMLMKDGQLISLSQALEQECARTRDMCSPRNLEDIRLFSSSKTALEQADQASVEMATKLEGLFTQDSTWLSQLRQSSRHIFPAPISARFRQAQSESEVLAQYFRLVFSGLDPVFNSRFPDQTSANEEDRKRLRTTMTQELSHLYRDRFKEERVLRELIRFTDDAQ